MKVTREQLVTSNLVVKDIMSFCSYFEDYDLEDSLLSAETIEEIIDNKTDKNNVYINIPFPGDEDCDIPIDEIIELVDEIKTIKIVNDGHIQTKKRSIYIVSANYSEHRIDQYNSVKVASNNGIQIKLLNSSVIVGLAATKLEQYDSDYVPTYTGYTAIEFEYDKIAKRLNDVQELDLLNSFIFEMADTTNVALIRNEIECPDFDMDDIDEDEIEKNIELRNLLPFNEGMNYFISAIQIEDHELKFLSFYKVLEHFAPIALKIDAHELMRKKLDTPKSNFDKGDYIKSIFDLASSVQGRFGDEELIKSAFLKCFDFIGLFEILPTITKSLIKKQLKVREIDYSLDQQKAITASGMVAKIVYKTRNNVVHAKSNYDIKGDEISESKDFEKLNEFMKNACSQTIRWYSRLPTHQKLQDIK